MRVFGAKKKQDYATSASMPGLLLQSFTPGCSTDILVPSAGVQPGCAHCSKQRALCLVHSTASMPAGALLSQDVCPHAGALAALALATGLRAQLTLLRH